MLPYGVAMFRWLRSAVLAGVCAGCGPALADTAPNGVPASVPAAIELAESQISASTVAAPATPGLCDPAEIEVRAVTPSTVDVEAGDAEVGNAEVADQVIEVVNRADVRCEVDVGDSPDAAEDLEPNVVLGPGQVAYLWISEAPSCEGSPGSAAPGLDLRVNGVGRVVPLTSAPGCAVELWAFFTH